MKITRNLARILKNALGENWREKVKNADFENADFENADFRSANFENADFENADFENADFRSANFRNVDFENYNKIHLISIANACIYPLAITLDILKKAKEQTEIWKQNKYPIRRYDESENYNACESGWKQAFGSEDYIITDNETHAFWFFCWRVA
jgi:hypothetical protein